MNKFHKIFAGLFAALALTAFVATGAMADDATDTHTVTINSGQILLIDVADEGGPVNDGDAQVDGDDDLLFDFSGAFDTAGGDETASDIHNAEVQHTANEEFTVSTCLDGSFGSFTSGTDSQSYLRAYDPDEVWSSDTAWYAWGEGVTNAPSGGPGGTGQNASDCSTDTEAETDSFSPNSDIATFEYQAQYDVKDGIVDNETATIQWTIQAAGA